MTYIQNILITINRAGCPSRSIRTVTASRNSGWFHSSLNNRHAIIQDNTNIGATTKTLSREFTTKNYGTPKTGLILPNNASQDNNDDVPKTIGATFQPTPTPVDPLISPLVNVNQSNLHEFSHATATHDLLAISENDHVVSPLMATTTKHPSNANGNTSDDTDSDVALDIASMYDPQIHLPHKPDFNDPSSGYETGTPLGDELMRYIGASGRGGISVAEYMGRCLRDEHFGYYTNPPSGDDNNNDEEFDDDDFANDVDYNYDDMKRDGENDWDNIGTYSGETLTTSSREETKGRGDRIIGAEGDFTTAPEISQIFGECLTVWLLAQYEIMGKPPRVQLVEIGPGRGTLICDVLRSASSIKGVGEDFVAALSADGRHGGVIGGLEGSSSVVNGVHLVEVSENLRASQFEALEALGLQMMKDNRSHSGNNADSDCDSVGKRELSGLNFDLVKWKTKEQEQEEIEAMVQKVRKRMDDQDEVDPTIFSEIMMDKKVQQQQQSQPKQLEATVKKSCSVPVHWYNTFNSIPSSTTVPTFIIGQEILDALPVHVFQKMDDGWKERLVDVAIREDDNDKNSDTSNAVKIPTRNGSTPTSSTIVAKDSKSSTKKPRFRYVLSSGTTPALRALLHVDDKGHPTTATNNSGGTSTLDLAPVGTVLEVCPEAMVLVQDITSRIDASNGAALLIDYGNEGSGDTLRAFRRHKQVDVLSCPGTVDITADVDFSALKDAVNIGMTDVRNHNNELRDKVDIDDNGKSIGIISGGVGGGGDKDGNNIPIAFGPVCQGQFLASMGAVERTLNLIDDENTTDDQAEDLCKALERLLSEEEMGQRYKVMAIARKKSGIFPPPGF